MMPWRHWPPRQLTGRPKIHHGYVGRHHIERWCGHDHRSFNAALVCSMRMARKANREGWS